MCRGNGGVFVRAVALVKHVYDLEGRASDGALNGGHVVLWLISNIGKFSLEVKTPLLRLFSHLRLAVLFTFEIRNTMQMFRTVFNPLGLSSDVLLK